MGIRLAAALLIAVQLTQLAAPAWCAPRDRAVPCHETTTPGTPRLTQATPGHDMPCAQSAMCAVTAVGLPGAAIVLPTPAIRVAVAPAAAVLRPGDQPPPLSPPPQA
jgi:hypothetical protein